MSDVLEKKIQRLQLQVMVLSLVVVAGGLLWAYQIGMAANRIDHELSYAGDDLKEMRLSIQKLEAPRS